MAQFNNLYSLLKMTKRVLMIKDSVTVSLFSGFLGTLAMDLTNILFWRTKKSEILYGHIAGSVLMSPFRTNQRKNFWLGQITHLITGSALAYPLMYILKKTGKDNYTLKGAFFGTVTWELIYGVGRRFDVFSAKPRLTSTHYAELFNNILYGITTAQALVSFSQPSMFPDNQSKTIGQNMKRNAIQPIYSDVDYKVGDTVVM